MVEDGVDAVGEAHVEHLVGFVEHDVLQCAQVHLTALHEVDESAGRGHDDLRTVTQFVHLRHDAGAAIHRDDVHAGYVLGK